MKIIVSPYSQKLRNGKENPKNYPTAYWQRVISSLARDKQEIVQIGRTGEPILEGIESALFDLSMKDLEALIRGYKTFISVDNFFPHFAHYHGLRGVVIFSQSSPDIFGYRENINLLKDRKYLRKDQFGLWESCNRLEEAFVEPQLVLDAIYTF